MRSNFNKEQKQQIVEAYFQSGKSQTVFAPDYGIKANTLSNWVKKYREENESSEVRFVELKSTVVTQRQPIRISKNGIQIEIPENSMPALLKEVISTLASL
ncbi:transposase [Treponema sp.]|uniref:IS66 family insertion sequence element accessory protein TnpA n=1 Tax=Treponema sp. TaxID=166 RepID=UPI002580670B|nr:transposase [Treponema sp.]